MVLKLGVLMDPISNIKPYKDSTFAMMLAAQAKGFKIDYFCQDDIFVEEGIVKVYKRAIQVIDQTSDFYYLEDKELGLLSDFDAILMRKDPPFNMEFIYTTYLLEMAEKQGTLIVNPPNALRLVNEKFYINYFPKLTPKTLVSRKTDELIRFIKTHGNCVIKPLDGMGGDGIFKVNADDPNLNVILETMGQREQNTLMVQAFLDKVVDGDKRILLVDGKPCPYGLSRIPQGKEFRANLAAGGRGVVEPLTEKELWICEQVSPRLKELGLLFVGLDVIGGHLTEINVTSPTCIREIEAETNEKIALSLMDTIETKVEQLKSRT